MQSFLTIFFRLFSIKWSLLFILLFYFTPSLIAQSKDSTKIVIDTSRIIKHAPQKAAFLSACLPGLGQAYNKKYWKIPIVYAGIGTVTFLGISNAKNYNDFKLAYKYRTDLDPLTIDNYVNKFQDEDLLTIKNYYRRNLELCYIIGFAVYALNIIDATVDAHLFEFDMSDDISMLAYPLFFASSNQNGAGINLTFKINSSKK
ncbi:MAG TPA: DUF5683 domain-containing protein [Bacteroidales bacterium]|nr:DUF5683 domain-containing protein [Bacteroidales bacterium]HPS45928.1 DUF5683 domain-containing protein [Bacteroidales bacterium]